MSNVATIRVHVYEPALLDVMDYGGGFERALSVVGNDVGYVPDTFVLDGGSSDVSMASDGSVTVSIPAPEDEHTHVIHFNYTAKDAEDPTGNSKMFSSL